MADLDQLAAMTGLYLERGSIHRGFVETPGYADSVSLQVPIIVVVGDQPGPTLAVIAAQHGREVNGIAAAYQALQQMDPATMAGHVLMYPVANPLCVRMQVQDFPTERNRFLKVGPESEPMNMNRQWPGDPCGSLSERLTNALWEGGVRAADCVVDLHCWTERHLGLAWGNQVSQKPLLAFGYPWFEVHEDGAEHLGTLESACAAEGIPCVVCELTPQNVVNPKMVTRGSRGVLNVARYLGIVPGKPERPETVFGLGGAPGVVVEAEADGLVVTRHSPGDAIDAGDMVVELVSLDALECIRRVTAEKRMVLRSVGCTWGTAQLEYSLVRRGETIATLAAIAEEYPPD
jgi:predicted deacylase